VLGLPADAAGYDDLDTGNTSGFFPQPHGGVAGVVAE